jgi:hypothetical protein
VPLQPFPEVTVCHAYTPADVLDAGGYPENLFIASLDSGQWAALPTDLDVADQRISALAPHLSVYGVAASRPATLPVTGAPVAPGLARVSIILLGMAGAALLLSRSTRRKR